MLRTKTDALLESGRSYREISALTGFDKYKISRHARHGAQAAKEIDNLSPLEQSDLRLRTLAERCEAQWLASASNGDGKSALDCLKTAVRLELEHRDRIQAQAAAAVQDTVNDGRPSVEWLDATVRKVRESRARDLQNGYVLCPICSFGRVHPKHIAERLPLLKAENNEHSGNPN